MSASLVGSEMCIRDSPKLPPSPSPEAPPGAFSPVGPLHFAHSRGGDQATHGPRWTFSPSGPSPLRPQL
eukprot:9721030-Alexandrium_andersonii.AAC.1